MISRRQMIAALCLSLGAIAAPQFARAEENEMEQAIAETREAISAGKQGQAASFVEHADQAIYLARAAVWRNPTDNIRRGIKDLRKAVKTAKGTSLDKKLARAVAYAESALGHFETVH